MKLLSLLPLVAATSAFVIPDEQTARSLQIEIQDKPASVWNHAEDLWHNAQGEFNKLKGVAQHKFDEAVEAAEEVTVKFNDAFETAFAGEDWLAAREDDRDLLEGPPHHGPPHHGPPHHGPPHHGGPHGPHHDGPNMTVYQLIASSKYTTKLAKAINEYPDLVKSLNGTKANFTVFAPTDRAFEKIPKHAPKPSKEFLKKILSYHVSPEFYPAGRVLVSRTIPTIVEAEHIKKVPQRLSTQIGFRGLTVNFYARVVAVNIFGTNGVIHGIDSILIPPPKTLDIVTALPGEFSTLELALLKTGLDKTLNDTSSHNGGTLFAPSNGAFSRLGPRVTAFLFSEHGLKYLKALILYHVVDDITLYSDALYKTKSESESFPDHRIPKGVYHIDLPTGLEKRSLSVDIARYGRLITIKINGFTRVVVPDGIASDGVIHVVPNVLIPPKEPGQSATVADENTTVEDIKEALAPFVNESDDAWNFEL